MRYELGHGNADAVSARFRKCKCDIFGVAEMRYLRDSGRVNDVVSLCFVKLDVLCTYFYLVCIVQLYSYKATFSDQLDLVASRAYHD